ncbi:FecCD family ABC transporter permease [Dietzia sp.]|uniref:FecCD family ABC transporter permease n=1 Tax=Dietzia sp. TaxID=1871616 RepID=UPI002FDA9FB3
MRSPAVRRNSYGGEEKLCAAATERPSAGGKARSPRGAGSLRLGLVLVLGFALLFALIVASLGTGSKALSAGEVLGGLFGGEPTPAHLIVWDLRMPRAALAVVVGAALAVAGVVMQALSRNPLAEPGLVGVNSGAALAVVLGTSVFGVSSAAGYVWFALAGAALAAIAVFALAARAESAGAPGGRLGGGRGAGASRARLVLAGAALTACLGSITGTITMYDTSAFGSYRFWVVGSVADRGTDVLLPVLPFVVVGLVLALSLGPSLNALTMGEDQAVSLGVRVGLVRGLAFCAVALLCGAATAAAGPIAFVGLVVPHVLRLLVGVELRRVLALSLVFGPSLVLCADLVGRIIARPGEIEAGIVTAFVGAPVLLWLLLRGKAS